MSRYAAALSHTRLTHELCFAARFFDNVDGTAKGENMGSLSALLDCYASKDLELLLREHGAPVSGTKASRIERLELMIRNGTIDFRGHIVDRTYKDALVNMCEAVGISSAGRVDELKHRLTHWFTESLQGRTNRLASGTTSIPQSAMLSHAPALPISTPSDARKRHSDSFSSVSVAERQFIRVTMEQESLSASLRSKARWFGESFLGATKVFPYTAGEGSSATFERGHPVDGGVYVLDPFSESQLHYLQAERADRTIAENKLSALTLIAGCLGAMRVELVAVKSQGRTTNNVTELDAIVKAFGLNLSMSSTRTSIDCIRMDWEVSEVKPIPSQYQPYLESMPDLRALAAMVYAGRAPSNLHREVSLDFRESHDIAVKVSKLSSVGSLSLNADNHAFAASSWIFGISFTRHLSQQFERPFVPTSDAVSGPTQAFTLPSSASATPGAPCPACRMPASWIAQYQRWFCAKCQQYV